MWVYPSATSQKDEGCEKRFGEALNITHQITQIIFIVAMIVGTSFELTISKNLNAKCIVSIYCVV